MSRQRHETCRYVTSTGELLVCVTPNCPRADLLNGTLVSSKIRCRDCQVWRGREAIINQEFEEAVKEMIRKGGV